ncbi:MAG TPA: hypothetical protein VHH34_21230 [Pseudonocardiaceae bacterium]|nr:hypothetical protein [Pseudonocardiaceae bacterium]
MLTDPQSGREGGCPYDLLAAAGVGPNSSMKEILDASFLLMEQGRWSPQVRAAWDELRTVERRLAVDFLRYDVHFGSGDMDLEDISAEVAGAGREVLAALQQQARTSPAELCDLPLGDLGAAPCEITLDSLTPAGTTAFDRPPPLPGADIVEFDR